MHTDFWLERWQEGQIGFHQDAIHPCLQQFFATLKLPPAATVFVPLCGKSLDMLWLIQADYKVIGIEISQQAVEAFFSENRLAYKTRQTDGFVLYESEGIQLYCGDFFQLRAEHVSSCQAIYDRAALIALPPEMRSDYAVHKQSLFPDGLDTLLITLDYAQDEMQGPPFSVPAEEVAQLYARDYQIDELQRLNIIEQESHFQQKGLSNMYETAYRLMPK